MDIDNEVQDCKFRGVREDFTTDREQQAYASVLYLLGALTTVVPDTNIQFIRKYISKKFPALGKCCNVDDMLLLCSPENRDELQRIAEAYRNLKYHTDTSEFDTFKFLERNELTRVKPAHEEDLKIEKIEAVPVSTVDKGLETYLTDSNGNKLVSYKSADSEYGDQIAKLIDENIETLIKASLEPFSKVPLANGSHKLYTLPY